MENIKQGIELSDIFREHANEFLSEGKLCPQQAKAYRAIVACRTAALGGHMEQCDHCGYMRHSYNSCRNRHCPKCQFVRKAQWVDKLSGNLPPVKYFHLVFTIPSGLHHLFYINQQKAYGLLFKAAGESLQQCAKKFMSPGLQTGSVAILHTWGQTLSYHPHIHMIVPAGGLSEDMMEWEPSGRKYFLPVKTLGRVFRGTLCRLLEKAADGKAIRLPENRDGFTDIRQVCYKKDWVVYCEKPFSGPGSLVNYLGNYTHRVAISNHRLTGHRDGKVSFWYKDYKSAGIRKQMTLGSAEFVRRFMQHVLPKGFCKIRYFGFMALCNMKEKLAMCFDLVEGPSYLPVLQGLSGPDLLRETTGRDPRQCPKCGAGRMGMAIGFSNVAFDSG
jgi:hypothetical protein